MSVQHSLSYSRTQSHDVQAHMDQIIHQTLLTIPTNQHKLAKKFIQSFYVSPAREQFTSYSHDQLTALFINMWTFYYHKTSIPKFIVERLNQASLRGGSVIINIAMPNMSFIVDSLLGLLNRFKIKHQPLLHPLFDVTRSSTGQIETLARPKLEKNNRDLESFIHCEINQTISDDLIQQLNSELAMMLTEVQAANQDWSVMRQQCNRTIQELHNNTQVATKATTQATIDFLKWIENGHYTFLGYVYYDLDPNSKEQPFKRNPKVPAQGILKNTDHYRLPLLFKGININKRTFDYIFTPEPLLINKTSQTSRVHRAVAMDSIGVRRFDADNNVVGIHVFVGLFTSVAYDSSARDIPMLRDKMDQIIYQAGFDPQWHDGKALSHILDSLPRDELFQATISELKEISLAVLRLQESSKVALFVRSDIFNRYLSCLVFIPRERFNSQLCTQFGDILAREFKGEISLYKAQFGSLPLARVHYTVTIPFEVKSKYNLHHIEHKLIEAAKTWQDILKINLERSFDQTQVQSISMRYGTAFSSTYQDHFSAQEACLDIVHLETLLSQQDMVIRLYNLIPARQRRLKLKIYNLGSSLILSDVMPLFDNLDLRVISEIPYVLKLNDVSQNIFIHDFELESKGDIPFDIKHHGQYVIDAFLGMYKGYIENDAFNRLITRVSLTWRTVIIFRAYAKYALQLLLPFSKIYIAQALDKNPRVTQLLWNYFQSRFDPRHIKLKTFDLKQLLHELDQIVNLDEDRILRLYYNLITATTRTNFYQKFVSPVFNDYVKDESSIQSSNIKYKSYISFKFHSALIDELPAPKPLYEIFVYSPRVEAIHLRGGKVARGGIRWSDRKEDFRTEILGLMKAQMVKNSIIVPVGSKGGFVIKSPTQGMTRSALQQEAITCYQIMMSGLLDITDNYVRGRTVRPKQTRCYDEFDPYLVVAADKGTATFSDTANAISQHYNFWLGDAFASGGSAGYDHKKMGITARGAWEGIKRHFREVHVDIQKQPFTVVGVGDMSGDVFGNGLLLSKKTLLIAAFNHHHIFIDPTPDPSSSFKERQRLFRLPQSTWMDYNQAVLSPGGQIYNRLSKTITLTPQIQKLFNLPDAVLKPHDLIKHILISSYDLMWLGGIGTFIKSHHETHAEVGDRGNDLIRVDANQLNCRVIGEGANLGVTQKGRIEFCRTRMGKINTDFIDNSAGVSCSDHEVNIKILFQHIVSSRALSMTQRNDLLKQMTPDIADLVIYDNYLQTQTLSVLDIQGTRKLDEQIALIHYLEQQGLIIRHLEGLPDDAGLLEYQKNNLCLTRPENAVLLSYSKISFYDQLLTNPIIHDPYFEKLLMAYFPNALHNPYHHEIRKHPLRKEIIATLIVNKIVNRMGPTFLQDCLNNASMTLNMIVHAFFVVTEIFDLNQVWQDIESLDTRIEPQDQLKAMINVYKILKRTMLWVVRCYPLTTSITPSIKALQKGVQAFTDISGTIVNHQESTTFHDQIKQYEDMHFPHHLSRRLALLNVTSLAPGIVFIADSARISVAQVADLYFNIGSVFHFNTLRQALDRPNLAVTTWERLQVNGLIDDLYAFQSQLTRTVLTDYHPKKFDSQVTMKDIMRSWIDSKSVYMTHLQQMSSAIIKSTVIDLASISVYTRDLRLVCGL